jgi:hypothetical protein
MLASERPSAKKTAPRIPARSIARAGSRVGISASLLRLCRRVLFTDRVGGQETRKAGVIP